MNIVIFTGPSLLPDSACEILDARCLPPVSQGDVYREALKAPEVIGIVDGYFRSVPSVWHKEILWALSRGISVYGSASMGALRAAELQPFGVIGVGWVYEAFRDGVLTDDDEVAVEHGPEGLGYACTSEAMVNIRRTLESAEHANIISNEIRLNLQSIAKSLYYPKRSYMNLIQTAKSLDLERSQIDSLAKWLPTGQINQKRIDAIDMLHEIRKSVLSGASPSRSTAKPFIFEHTEMWEEVVRSADY
jgi:hypothetical protein